MTIVDTQAEPQSPQGAAAALELQHINAGYGRTKILRDVSLVLPAGGVVALLGSNGAGKTTLLKVASGLLAPSAGKVMLNGADVTHRSAHRRSGHGLAHIPESRGIYRSLTVRENLRMQVRRGNTDAAIGRAVTAFPVLGRRLSQVAGTLSGGEQQMLSMAAAHVRDAKVILVDEASLGLAPVVVDAVFEFLGNVADTGASLLIVDQFVARALAVATTAYLMRRGEIVFAGSPQELSDDLFTHYVDG